MAVTEGRTMTFFRSGEKTNSKKPTGRPKTHLGNQRTGSQSRGNFPGNVHWRRNKFLSLLNGAIRQSNPLQEKTKRECDEHLNSQSKKSTSLRNSPLSYKLFPYKQRNYAYLMTSPPTLSRAAACWTWISSNILMRFWIMVSRYSWSFLTTSSGCAFGFDEDFLEPPAAFPLEPSATPTALTCSQPSPMANAHTRTERWLWEIPLAAFRRRRSLQIETRAGEDAERRARVLKGVSLHGRPVLGGHVKMKLGLRMNQYASSPYADQ